MLHAGVRRRMGACLFAIGATLLLPATLMPCSSSAARAEETAPAGSVMLVPSSDGRVQMRTLVYRPPGKGPFPLAILSHGSSSSAEIRVEQDVSRLSDLAAWFARRGYVVAVPQRPGHGQTGGEWLEDYGSCSNPDYDRSGRAIASNIGAAIGTLALEPFVQKRPALLVGHSAGAWGSLAFASVATHSAVAVIDFAGGLGGRSYDEPNRNCAPERLIATLERYGRTVRIPTIWLYARNDTYFGPQLSSDMAAAFRKSGGNVEYHLLPAAGEDGHFLVFDKAAQASWSGLVDAFLQRLKPAR